MYIAAILPKLWLEAYCLHIQPRMRLTKAYNWQMCLNNKHYCRIAYFLHVICKNCNASRASCPYSAYSACNMRSQHFRCRFRLGKNTVRLGQTIPQTIALGSQHASFGAGAALPMVKLGRHFEFLTDQRFA